METQHTANSYDDDFYISILLNDSENPQNNSDENVALELQLQEAIISSFITLQKPGNDSSSGEGSIEIGESSTKGIKEAGESSTKGINEAGESSKRGLKEAGESSQTLCEICAERKDTDDMFPLDHCNHSFCTDCISKHVSIKIKKQQTIFNTEKGVITCPGDDCTSIIKIDPCRELLHGDVISMWDDVLCESMISPKMKFYCPYNNCSELLVKESGDQEVIREAECPFCNRLFCAKCSVPWHPGVDCEEFLRLKEDEREREDLMVHDLAKKKKWQRCPNCNFYVERNEGCLHMTCRCGFQFCYACGKDWTSTHGGCQ